MAVEARRGCGFRKVGGLYLVSGGLSAPCMRLPVPLSVCPTCSHGIKQSRGFTWVTPEILKQENVATGPCGSNYCGSCPLGNPALLGERCGLLWIGEAYYKRPEDFTREAGFQGVSRRIPAVPRGFKVGEHWILLAHPLSVRCKACDGMGCDACEQRGATPGIFHAFKPDRLEKIVTDLTPESELEELRQQGITPVVVPHDDPDHNPQGDDAEGAG